MSLLKVDSAYARYILSMQTAVLCYTQPLNNGVFTAYEYFLSLPLSITPTNTNFYQSINDVEILDEFNLLQNLHLSNEKSVCATSSRPFGEVGGKLSLQFNFHRTHILLKLKTKMLL